MDARTRDRIEVETIHELLSELTAFQLLGIPAEATADAVDAAFRAESRRLHPDRLAAGATPDFKTKANAVFKAVGDSYRTLRDPESRAAYESELRARVDAVAEEARRKAAADAAAKADPSKAARTPKGEQYWKRGLQCFQDGDFNGAVMQINFALQFEADNAVFREYLDKAKAGLAAKKADKTGNTYRIRL
jgi:curved DNA-binding protein CbpA